MLICASGLRNLPKTAKRVIGCFGRTAVFLLVLLQSALNAIQNIHTYKNNLLRGCGGHIFFFFSGARSNIIYPVDVTQLQTQRRRFVRWKIVSTESECRTVQGPTFFCVNQLLQQAAVSSADVHLCRKDNKKGPWNTW